MLKELNNDVRFFFEPSAVKCNWRVTQENLSRVLRSNFLSLFRSSTPKNILNANCFKHIVSLPTSVLVFIFAELLTFP